MHPSSTFVIYDNDEHEIESVHPYWEIGVARLEQMCWDEGIDPKAQHRFIVCTLVEAIDFSLNERLDRQIETMYNEIQDTI